MNILACLAILLGLIAIALAVKLSMMVERKTNKRPIIGAVPPPPALQAAALDLMAECELLERRNDFLEARWLHCKDVLAASMTQVSMPRRDKRMEVAEMQEAP